MQLDCCIAITILYVHNIHYCFNFSVQMLSFATLYVIKVVVVVVVAVVVAVVRPTWLNTCL